MQIQLLADYRGVLTDEQYYLAGLYADGDMPETYAKALVRAGRALVIEPDPEPDPPVVTSVTKRLTRGKK